MGIAQNALTIAALAGSFLIFPAANAELLRLEELVCSGTVTYGQKTFSDQIILRISSSDVKVSGEAGAISTFEGMLPYKICVENEDEVNFEYTTSQSCGSSATRNGSLRKMVGSLRLARSDRGEPFIGNYTCKRAQPVLR